MAKDGLSETRLQEHARVHVSAIRAIRHLTTDRTLALSSAALTTGLTEAAVFRWSLTGKLTPHSQYIASGGGDPLGLQILISQSPGALSGYKSSSTSPKTPPDGLLPTLHGAMAGRTSQPCPPCAVGRAAQGNTSLQQEVVHLSTEAASQHSNRARAALAEWNLDSGHVW